MDLSPQEIVNVPNSITLARLMGVGSEAVHYAQAGDLKHFIRGGAYFFLDVLDGPAARMLDQETEFGEAIDPFVDKASVLLLGGAALRRGEVDTSVLAAVGIINVSNLSATSVAKARGVLDDKVSRAGKLSQLGMNTGLGLNVIGNNIRKSDSHAKQLVGNALRWTGAGIAVLSAGTLGVHATGRYWRQALRKKP